jgi:hypothetical protein
VFAWSRQRGVKWPDYDVSRDEVVNTTHRRARQPAAPQDGEGSRTVCSVVLDLVFRLPVEGRLDGTMGQARTA